MEGNDKSNPFFESAESVLNAKQGLRHPRLKNRVTKGMETLIAAIVADNYTRRQGSEEGSRGAKWAPLDPDTVAKRARQKNKGFAMTFKKSTTRIPKGQKGAGRFKSEITKGKAARRLFPNRTQQGDFTGTVSKRTVGPAVSQALAIREGKSGTPLSSGKQKEFASGIIPLVDTGSLFKSVAVQFTAGAAKLLAGSSGHLAVMDEGTWTGGHALKWTIASNKITIAPKGLRGKARLKFRVHNRPTSDLLKAGRGSKIPGREFFYLNPKDTDLISNIILILGLVQRYKRGVEVGIKKGLTGPLFKTTPSVVKKSKPYVRSRKISPSGYGAQRYYSELATRLPISERDTANQAQQSGQAGWRAETAKRKEALEQNKGTHGTTVERRQGDVFKDFLNDAKKTMGKPMSEGLEISMIQLISEKVRDRLERAGVFELAIGVNVRQNALKHLKRRGK